MTEINEDDVDVSWLDNLKTLLSTYREKHAFVEGLACGLSEDGKLSDIPKEYRNEKHYYDGGWIVGELIDRLSRQTSENDTKIAYGWVAGVAIKWLGIAIIGYIGINVVI